MRDSSALARPRGLLSGRSYGFYVTLGTVVLSVVTAIVYAALYSNTPRFMSWPAFAVILAGGVLALILLLLRFGQIASAVVALADLAGLLLFIRVIYNYVVVVMAGIDLSSFEARFIVCTVLFVLSLAAGIVSVFSRQTKEAK